MESTDTGKKRFSEKEITDVTDAVMLSEELVSNYYKMSSSEWLHGKYDVKTMAHLSPHEIVDGPFAQVIRYRCRRDSAELGSDWFDFYHICLQDHNIINAMTSNPELLLFPFITYIVTHELVHIVRFSKFMQLFDALPREKMEEEHRVHYITRAILKNLKIKGIQDVIRFYSNWHQA